MTNYPQELAQDAVCQNHTGHVTGLWFLPTRPLRLNTNELINFIINYEKFEHICYQMNKNLKHKELLKLWTQRKGERSNKSEHFQNSDIWM